MLVFAEGGKPETRKTRRKTLEGEKNQEKLNPLMASGSGIELGPHWWEASALTTASSLLPLKVCGQDFKKKPNGILFLHLLHDEAEIWNFCRLSGKKKPEIEYLCVTRVSDRAWVAAGVREGSWAVTGVFKQGTYSMRLVILGRHRLPSIFEIWTCKTFCRMGSLFL